MNRIILTFPPSVNHMYCTTKFGRRVIKKAGKEWMATAEQVIALQSPPEPYELLKELILHFFWPNLLRSDASNRLKMVEDALVAGGLISDDRWSVIPNEIMRSELDRENPRIEVTWEVS